MKENRILSTAGICPKNSTKLRSYCNLLQSSLSDRWLFADDFVESHVCFVQDDYLINMDKKDVELSQVIVVVNVTNKFDHDNKYQISTPLNGNKIQSLLNKISKDVKFKTPEFV